MYDQKRASLKSGDLLLFSGKGRISTWIKRLTRSRWSHVGMVLRVPEYDMLLCWESTTLSNVPDLETGTPLAGVQLVGLRDRLKSYDGDVACRPLRNPLTPAQARVLGAFRSEVSGRPYEGDRLELLRSAWDSWGGQNEEDLSMLFCSELIAESYQRVGLLPERIPSNEWTPKDFAPGGDVDRHVEFRKSFGLWAEVRG